MWSLVNGAKICECIFPLGVIYFALYFFLLTINNLKRDTEVFEKSKMFMDMEIMKEEPEDSTDAEPFSVKDEETEEQIGWFSKQFNYIWLLFLIMCLRPKPLKDCLMHMV